MMLASRRFRLVSVFAAALLALAAQRGHGQTVPPPAAATPVPAPSGTPLPVAPAAPKGPENPVRRFEIVSLGAFPIMLFYTDFSFDVGRFLANGRDPAYAPWPFKNQYSAPLSDSDRLTRIGAALGACLVVGAIDAVIHAAKVKKARLLLEYSALPAQAPPAAAPPSAEPAQETAPAASPLPTAAPPAATPQSAP